MMKKEKYHFKPNQVKFDIIDFLLKNNDSVSEPEIYEHLNDQYGGIDQSNVNRPLRWLHGKGCLELEKRRSNNWSIKTLKNLENILVQYPDLVEILQNSEHALDIVLNAMIGALTMYVKPEYKEIEEINQYLAPIRADLRTKLKLSASFFKLCITPEYNMFRNLSDLLGISDEGPHAHCFVIDEVPSVFVKSAAGADVAFKACVAIEIISRPTDSRKDMKKEIEYVKEMKNQVSETQLNNLKKYYEKLKNEADILKQIENTDPDKQLECLKQHYKKLLKAPHFLQSKKFVPVDNLELCKLEKNFQNDDDDAWDYLDDKETEGPA